MTLAVCLVTASAAPSPTFFLPAGATLSLTSAGLVTTSAAGVVLNTVPLGSILLAKGALAGKALLLKAILEERAKNN